jgi:hypothetical protein
MGWFGQQRRERRLVDRPADGPTDVDVVERRQGEVHRQRVHDIVHGPVHAMGELGILLVAGDLFERRAGDVHEIELALVHTVSDLVVAPTIDGDLDAIRVRRS